MKVQNQGIMFGYTCTETEDLMPAPIDFSHKILRLMAEDRKKGVLKGTDQTLKVRSRCYMKTINLLK